MKRQKNTVRVPPRMAIVSSTPQLCCFAQRLFGAFGTCAALNAPGRSLLLAGFLGGISMIGPVQADMLPQGAQLRSGALSMADGGGVLSIAQTSGMAVVDWSSFSIGERNHVLITQPSAQSLLVNRVISDAPSVLAGAMLATGQVALINPNGIAITPTGKIITAGFLASTLRLDDDALQEVLKPDNSTDLHGDLRHLLHGSRLDTVNSTVHSTAETSAVARRASQLPTPPGVTHDGSIRVAVGGTALLLGANVNVGGMVVAPGGRIAIVAADQAAQAAQPTQAQAAQAAQPAQAQAAQAEQAQAARGPVSGAPAAAQAALPPLPAVLMRGVLHASAHLGRPGQVLIAADGKSLDYRGETDVSAVAGKGGSIELYAADITAKDGLLIATGHYGGGKITINTGDAAAENAHVNVRAVTWLLADTIKRGRGGDIAISTLGDLRFNGIAHAKGARDAECVRGRQGRGARDGARDGAGEGARDGAGEGARYGAGIADAGLDGDTGGGTILFHAGTHLAVQGEIDASQREGASVGQVEFRARALQVADSQTGTKSGRIAARIAERLAVRIAHQDGNRVGNQVRYQVGNQASSRVIKRSTSEDASGLTVQHDLNGDGAGHAAGGALHAKNGARVRPDSIVDAATLSRSLQTSHVVLSTNTDASSAAFSDIDVLTPVEWTANHALVMYSVGNTNIHAPIRGAGRSAAVHFTMASGGRLKFPGGSVILPGMHSLVSVDGTYYDMIRSPHDMVAALSRGDNGHYALATPINMASADFQPISTPPGKYFSHFEGMGNTISNMRVDAPALPNVGLFSKLGAAACVSNIVFENARVTGMENVGILSGTMDDRSLATGLTFVNSSATLGPAASVSAWADRLASGTAVGGVTGTMRGESFIQGINGGVHVRGEENVGGVAGAMASTSGIAATFLQGNVAGTHHVGGLVGQMSGIGLVNQSVWRGAVRGISTFQTGIGAYGGLVGYQKSGTIARSQAFGTVSGLVSVGGLVGMAAGNAVISNCHVANQVTGARYTGSVAGIVADDAKLALINVEQADRRVAHIGAVASYSEGVLTQRTLVNAAPALLDKPVSPRSVVRSAAMDAQYIPALVSPPVSPVASPLLSENTPDRDATRASSGLLVLPPTPPSTSLWVLQSASSSAPVAVSTLEAGSLPILASPPLSPRISPPLSPQMSPLSEMESSMVPAEEVVVLPAAFEMPARSGYGPGHGSTDAMVDVEPMITDVVELTDPATPQYEWPTHWL